MMPIVTSNDNIATKYVEKKVSFDKENRQDSYNDKPRLRPAVTSQRQDELSDAATRSGQTSFKTNNLGISVSPPYMATEEKRQVTYPVINDVRTLQVPGQAMTTHQERLPTMIHSSPSEQSRYLTKNTTQPVHSDQIPPKNIQLIPQRPQDLIDNVSIDSARENFRSSAQYRKSYAFKIWRDKGSFPYRLAEQPVVKEVAQRKKSKKYMNAVRAQRDRENEEAWKTFKSCRTTTNEMRYRRSSKFPRIRVEANVITNKHYEKEQLDTLLSQDIEQKGRTMKQQNCIPDYFKNKKESAQKTEIVHSPTKSIPTSVIHVLATKPCDVSVQTNQAEQRTHNSKRATLSGVESQSYVTSEGKLSPDKQGGSSQWSNELTSSIGNYNMHAQSPEVDANAENGVQQISTETFTKNKQPDISNSFRETIPSNTQSEQEGSPAKRHCSPSLSTVSPMLSNNSFRSGEATECLPTYLNGDENTSQARTPSPILQAQEVDNSILTSVIKNSLAKKYSKENVKPNAHATAVERNRKRVRGESLNTEEGEPPRGRIKQQKATMFTRLDEAVATNLAEGIHNVNSEYFPIEALAKKAANETSKGVSDNRERRLETTSVKHKLDEIERARLLLKELFDVTSESSGDNEMKTFDHASRSFGRKNILNHLSLIDRYFAEFQKKLSSWDRPTLLPS
ncbi:uncharacterized protein LOC114525290 [Dendronephthya gigantea]|uniref:uncharacterized protein LOC114525290 n=1 Tax=Dendronephthya gigantea TaxID=151771 RepID=UPI00106A2794|nr:uncharacterized protein LOC114525290 [Dendronephthya gigantea]